MTNSLIYVQNFCATFRILFSLIKRMRQMGRRTE